MITSEKQAQGRQGGCNNEDWDPESCDCYDQSQACTLRMSKLPFENTAVPKTKPKGDSLINHGPLIGEVVGNEHSLYLYSRVQIGSE